MIGFILGFISCLALLFVILIFECKHIAFKDLQTEKVYAWCRDFPTSMKWGVERKEK
jgi:hypothetical protein